MKRLTLLTILLVVVGLTAGALEVKPTFTLSGWAKVEWGVTLDAPLATGFKNSSDADLTVTFMAADGTDTKKGEGPWYGEITISDVEVWLGGDDAGTITGTVGWLADTDVAAKIVGMGGKLAIGVFAAPDTGSNTDFVAAIENDDGTDDDMFIDDETAADVDTVYAGPGTYVSYMITDTITVGFEIVSQYDYATNTANGYAGALDVKAVFAPITVTAGFNMGAYKQALVAPDWNDPVYNAMGFGVKVSADTAMIDPWVGFDGQSNEGAFTFDIGAGAKATFLETVTAEVGLVYGKAFNDLDVKVVFTEPAAKGLVDGLDLTFTAYLFDLVDTAPAVLAEYEFILDGGYLMGKLYPNFTVTYYNNNASIDPLLNFPTMKVVAGVDWTAIPLTTLGLYYTSGDLLKGEGVLGTVVVSAKVAY